MPRRHSQRKVVSIILVLVLVVLFISAVQLPVENRISFMIYPWPATTTWGTTSQQTTSQAGTPPAISLSFVGKQNWIVYDKTHQTVKSYPSKNDFRMSFGVSEYAGVYSNIIAGDTGWIRVEQYYDAEQYIPEFNAPGYGTGYIILTRYLDGDFLIDGAKYSSVELMAWNHPSSWTQYIGGWGHEADVVFMSHDTQGTRRTAVFYIVLDPSRKPADCSEHPTSCVDVSRKVAEGKDFTMEANLQEHWDDWIFYTDVAHTVFGPCDTRFTVPKAPVCIKHDNAATQGIKWGIHAITEFGQFTTITSGTHTTTSFKQTQTTAVIGTVKVYVTTTSNIVIVSQVYTNQTVVNTVTAEPPAVPGMPGFCKAYPDFPLCQWTLLASLWAWLFASTVGIPNWALLVVGIIILWLLYMWATRPKIIIDSD